MRATQSWYGIIAVSEEQRFVSIYVRWKLNHRNWISFLLGRNISLLIQVASAVFLHKKREAWQNSYMTLSYLQSALVASSN